MPKIHITTLLRPRATYKTTTQQKQQQQQQPPLIATIITAGANQQTPNSDTNEIEEHLLVVNSVAETSSLNNIEFIPTLEFVDTTTTCVKYDNLQQCLETCLQVVEEIPTQQQHASTSTTAATYSAQTFTVERTTSDQEQQQAELSLSSSLIDTSDLLQQEVQQFSLTDTASFITYFDEPTSSISLGIMETTTTHSNKSLSEQRSTTDHMPASTTPTTTTKNTTSAATTATSQSNVPQSLANPSLSETADEEEEIEEEIEEALEMSEEQDYSNSLPGPSKKPQMQQLFGIELSESSSAELRVLKEQMSKSKSLKSETESDQFKIDDDQLSGGKLAQHFVIDDEEDSDFSGDIELPSGKRLVHSKHESSELEHELGQEEEEQEQSLANQSTADDVSELEEEAKIESEVEHRTTETTDQDLPPSATKETLKTSLTQESYNTNETSKAGALAKTDNSKELSTSKVLSNSKELNNSKETSPNKDETKAEKAKSPDEEKLHTLKTLRPEFFENPNIKPLSGASSLHSEKDHSIEEIMASNQSLEMTFDERDLSSLNPSFDINNETLVNELLADTPDRMTTKTTTTSKKEVENVLKESKECLVESFLSSTKVPESQPDTQQIEEDNPEHILKEKAIIALDTMPKLKENITVSIIPNEQVVEELFEKTLQSEMITDLDDSLPDLEEKPSTSKQAEKDLKNNFSKSLPLKEHQAKIEQLQEPWSTLQINTKEEDDEETSLQLMKLRIMAMKIQPKENAMQLSPTGEASGPIDNSQTKAMERVSLVDFAKDVLEDITEESERNSLSTQDEQNSLTHEKSGTLTSKSESKTLNNKNDNSNSTVSLNMIQMLEQKVGELQQMLATKDACLASLNLQLEHSNRRDSQTNNNSSELLGSGRDSSSLVTNSTEYRTFQEDFGQPTMDIYMELSKRDELIAKLNDSLQQSLSIREHLQTETEKLNHEINLLRKQLSEAMESCKKSYWPRDQESNYGQRISEISMDLVSESDDDLDRLYLTDNDEKMSRNSRERQLSMPRQYDYATSDVEMPCDSTAFSKQIEQFQKYLTPSEVRLFFMVQKKFDDYLCQELEKSKMKYDQELKIIMDQWDTEKQEKDLEIQKLLQHKQEREAKHNQEMEDLRKYFETKCAELEKQYSDDVFSQKSQRHGMSSSSASDCSDQEQLPDDFKIVIPGKSKESSPRKRSKAELLLSPSHRQMTPGSDNYNDDVLNTNQGTQLALEITELKTFYQNKIHEIQRSQEENIKKLSDRLKYYESRYPEDEFMSSTTKNSTLNSTHETTATINTEDLTQITVRSLNQTPQQQSLPNEGASATPFLNNNNNSLIIIDQDELNGSNEAQVIQKIIDEYERRLQEQLALAREDIVHELEQQIQTLLSESTTDDQHWPKELILLREKFTAKSQLEIAQLQIKHADEMSRLKQDYEKQLNRKNKRHSTFDSVRDFDKLLSERDSLRELSKAFRQVLSELLKCVANCENDLTENLAEEVQRLLSCNRTLEEHTLEDFTLNSSLLNDTLNTSKLRMIPDVQSLLEVVEDPSLVQYVNEKNADTSEDFDLKDCLERLRSEASFLLHLSEEVVKKHDSKERRESFSSEREKHDSEQEDGLKMQQQQRKFIRVNSLNEQQLPTHQSSLIQQAQNLTSLPPDLNKFYLDNNSCSTNNASELNFQLVELKNRLVKSENDRLRLQQELDHTISRNSDLGQELQHLRDQLSHLSSLNNVEYNEGYGLGSMKSPQRLSHSEHSSSSFALLQEKARNILSTPTQKQQNNDSTVQLLQMIEDFCREGDKVVECSKKDREDLQSQIITADKQLKATRQFLDEQAAEREQERDEFMKEIENLKAQLRDKEKERSSYANASEEVENLETQIRDLTQKLQESSTKRDKFEVELKASIDKIFVLREIISDLETQVETKALNEHVMGEKVKQLEEFINTQSRSNETLQSEVQSLKTEIEQNYQVHINQLEEKLQNIRPSAEQSIIMDQVVEQLRDIENTLEQKTKNLESIHSNTNSCSLSITEDVSVHGAGKATQSLLTTIVTPPQGSPVHPSPRQHSLTMEGVQRVVDKLSKHSRVEEAAVKRIRDLEMQIQQMRTACVHERESLQERMSEQTQRISALQSRLEEQRQRAEELQRSNTSDLNIRIHDLQNELQNLRETLSNRDKQIATMKQQLEKSKMAIDRLEAELAVEQQPDRSALERLENELKQKQAENQKLKDKIKNEMINKLALPDLMETMLADKNEEIDHLKEQLESKEKELQSVLDISQASSVGAGRKPEEASTKLSARTLSDIVSITEFDEPDVVRRAAAHNLTSPLMLPEGSGGFLHNTMETSKGVVANLTHKRTEDLSGFTTLQQVNTFDHPHYFQDPNILGSAQSGASITPALVPRQINFSAMTEDSKLKTPNNLQTPDNKQTPQERLEDKDKLEQEIKELKEKIQELEKEKEKSADYLLSSQLRLTNLQDELANSQKELLSLQAESKKNKELQQQLMEKSLEIEDLLREQDKLKKEKTELLSKNEKNLRNYQESEETLVKRLREMEEKLLKNTENEMKERENLRKELLVISESHEQCKYVQRDSEDRKKQIELLNQEIKTKDERLLTLSTKLSIAEDTIGELQIQITNLEKDVEKLKQQNSDNSSKQFSVDEIAQQVEKELNYSAQLDSNILKAIESEEENNLDRSHQEKTVVNEHPGTTDDENFTGERELLNQLEALKAQISVEREHAEDIRQELLLEKQHSQEVQEQDVVIIEAMRKRLESALEQEDELHKQLDIERERCERLQTQLTTLQRTDSRRNSSLLKSPTESPRKSPRSLNDFESELADRLRSEIKLLTAQNERERERSADLQRNTERERSRYEKELTERIEYCEKLKREMDKVARDKDNAEMEIEHLQERLTLQTQEIESLEARIASLQEAETRRFTRKEKQHKEYAQMMAEIQELKTQLYSLEAEKEGLNKTINQLRFDVERSAQREIKLAEALANANQNLAMREGQTTVPEQFLQKMKEINTLLAENTQENKQMAETVQYLVEERRQLQRKCEELESQLNGSASVSELEERCNHLLGRYLRVESHRKALVYQKRYLKISLQNYQDSEQRALAAFNGGHLLQNTKPKKKLKTVALAIIAIQRMKYIGRIWHTGKRIVSKSVFTITQQKRSQPPTISCAAITSTSPTPHQINGQHQHQYQQQLQTQQQQHHHQYHQQNLNSPLKLLDRPYAPLKTPTLLNGNRTPNSASSSSTSTATAFEWPRVTVNKMNKKT
ncbi:golgin subfamily B member 1 isoform X2 [Lucilia cuprina]|uniref:golgin subfamily B member 1 isoform X2 n=1 Tax=Lucilia cuprina TaxID=7375 RepID=UPI001F056001|nr:golgin subfamily B member 1 isoform X2 [Lucilia cuprina]